MVNSLTGYFTVLSCLQYNAVPGRDTLIQKSFCDLYDDCTDVTDLFASVAQNVPYTDPVLFTIILYMWGNHGHSILYHLVNHPELNVISCLQL